MPDIVTLQGVCKTFHSADLETLALADIDLAVRQGEYLAISGPSGCGKSTLLSLLGLLDSPSSGSYRFQGREVSSLGRNEQARLRNQHIGFIFQSFNLIGSLNVEDNVALPLTYRDGMDKAEIRSRVREALESVGMTHRRQHFPSQLSGGQQQRVAVARAIVGRPSLLLADEPTGNLDSRSAESVMLLLRDLHAAGATICLVTHDPRACEWAARTVQMFDGHIVADDPSAAPRHWLQGAEVTA
ncbi:ABC transporter ATP-binding protein [Xenophilus sp. AP218F]|nr:ABC transporter ATP-binding protein [Chromobacterium sp. ASV5]OWY37138.1 ABC transporter ATP-binding protein [Xenophilus sp. AP218F]